MGRREVRQEIDEGIPALRFTTPTVGAIRSKSRRIINRLPGPEYVFPPRFSLLFPRFFSLSSLPEFRIIPTPVPSTFLPWILRFSRLASLERRGTPSKSRRIINRLPGPEYVFPHRFLSSLPCPSSEQFLPKFRSLFCLGFFGFLASPRSSGSRGFRDSWRG